MFKEGTYEDFFGNYYEFVLVLNFTVFTFALQFCKKFFFCKVLKENVIITMYFLDIGLILLICSKTEMSLFVQCPEYQRIAKVRRTKNIPLLALFVLLNHIQSSLFLLSLDSFRE